MFVCLLFLTVVRSNKRSAQWLNAEILLRAAKTTSWNPQGGSAQQPEAASSTPVKCVHVAQTNSLPSLVLSHPAAEDCCENPPWGFHDVTRHYRWNPTLSDSHRTLRVQPSAHVPLEGLMVIDLTDTSWQLTTCCIVLGPKVR